MRNRTKQNIIIWTKRVSGIATVFVWISIFYTISQTSVPLSEQIPYCMGSTMLLFTLLMGVFKGLEYWEKQEK